MDSRVKKAVLSKIGEATEAAGEIKAIQKTISAASPDDLVLGIAVGRIYNSFHYQTRRILGRNATEKEFEEFLELLSDNLENIRRSCQQ